MRAKTVNENINFQRSGDVKKSLRVGEHKVYGEQELIDKIFDNLLSEMETDPGYKNWDQTSAGDNLYAWIVSTVEDSDGEIKHPGDLTYTDYLDITSDY